MQTMEPKLRGTTADSGITPGSSVKVHCIRCALVGLVVGLSLLAFPFPTRAQGKVNSEYLRDRSVNGHPIEIRRLAPDENSHNCQLIFVRAADMKAAPKIFAGAKGSSVLTVGEANGFATRGGIVNLTREENRLRFEVNTNAAAQSRLKISSKLLALAKIVD